MTALEKVRDWLTTYPEYDILGKLHVDYTDQVPANGGLFPNGLIEVSRSKDIFGNVTIQNQYNFGLYYVFEKAPNDDEGAAFNADWVMDFQEWVQEQSVMHEAPVFGDILEKEIISAQNGVMYDANEEGIATYMVQLSVTFYKEIEVVNKWLT